MHIRHTAAFLTILTFAAANRIQADTPAWQAAFGKGVVEQPSNAAEKAASERPRPMSPPAAKVPVTEATPPVALPTINAAAQAQADAESLVATFNAAVDAGSNAFGSMRSTTEVVAALSRGVPGGGRYADTTYKVPGLDSPRQAAALQRLTIQNGRIVVAPQQAAAPSPAPPVKDSRTAFASGQLKVQVPRHFVAEEAANGDLTLRMDGATLVLHLEASATGLDAWSEVRAASDRNGTPLSMSGKKVYITEPDRRAPKKVTVGFGQTLVTIKIDAESTGSGNSQLRLALPGIINSLAEIRG